MAGTLFDTGKDFLSKLLDQIQTGAIQLPDFQRGWIWDDERIRSLLASVSLEYPIGAIMILQTGNSDVNFKPRPVEGVTEANLLRPESLVLDGQQRLTSLYQSLLSRRIVSTKDARGREIERWYYIDMEKALDPEMDREEAIIGVPADRVTRNFRNEVLLDYSTPEREYECQVFPLAEVFDSSDWRTGFQEHWKYDPEKTKLWNEFERDVLKKFEKYQLPVITMFRETPKEAVCQVFEKVNTGGVALNVFELLTATFAAGNFNLRDDWTTRERALSGDPVLRGLESTDFLQAVTLLVTQQRRVNAVSEGVPEERAPGISCKRKDILRLTKDQYTEWADAVQAGFVRAARFLHGQYVFAGRDLPYRTQVVPLAAILSVLPKHLDNDTTKRKLTQWYWCGVFGELYGGAVESRFALDLPQVLSWTSGGAVPKTVTDATFAPARLLGLRTRNSAAYKGLYTMLLRGGAEDFRTGEQINQLTYFDERIDIHHIFPQAWCQKNGISPTRCDSIINKTPLSVRTNRMIGGSAPSAYLRNIESREHIASGRMDEILRTNLVEPGSIRSDSFDAFFADRERALLSVIEGAMGKPVLTIVEEVVEEALEYEQDNDAA